MMKPCILKVVILIGGSQKGTRFRPLSIDVPKVLFPIGGEPLVQHQIEACSKLPEVSEILIIGCYLASELDSFITEMGNIYNVPIRYLQEFKPLGTAGSIYHFRDQISSGVPDAFILMNGDICADFDLAELVSFHLGRRSDQHSGVDDEHEQLRNTSVLSVMATKANPLQSLHYGCIVKDGTSDNLMHYVEKPSSYVSSLVNCGIYVIELGIFVLLKNIFLQKHDALTSDSKLGTNRHDGEQISLERDLMPVLASEGRAGVYVTERWWSPIKTPGSAIYANRHRLQIIRESDVASGRNRLAPQGNTGDATYMGNVFVHSSARIHPTAVIGPNVSIGPNVTVKSGSRIRESILLGNSVVGQNSLVLYTIVGWNSQIGDWCRLEGSPNEPNPNLPFMKVENSKLFSGDGKLIPSITVLGSNVFVESEIVIINSIVLPHKQLRRSYRNEVIL